MLGKIFGKPQWKHTVRIPGKTESLHGKCVNDLYPVNRKSVMVHHVTWYFGGNRTCLSTILPV